jgi:hypothetical protein
MKAKTPKLTPQQKAQILGDANKSQSRTHRTIIRGELRKALRRHYNSATEQYVALLIAALNDYLKAK